MAELRSGAQILDQMEVNNSARLTPQAHRRLKRLMPLPAWQGDDVKQSFQADFLEAELIESLGSCSDSSLRPALKTHRSDLVRDLVRLSFQNSTEPISLLDLCKVLFTTKTTLTVSCREMFGYGPSALLRRIRLQQVHYVLRHPEFSSNLAVVVFKRLLGILAFSAATTSRAPIASFVLNPRVTHWRQQST